MDGRVLQVESLRGGGSPSELAAANDRATSTSALFENQQHIGSVPRANPATQFAPQSLLLFLRRELRPQKLFPFCPSKVGTVDLVPAISSQKRVKFFEDCARPSAIAVHPHRAPDDRIALDFGLWQEI